MNKFDQHIKDKLSQPQLPPMDAWKNIQEKLDEKEKKKRIIPLFYWIGSTAACLVAGVSIYYFYQNETINANPNPTNEIVKKSTQVSPKKGNETIDSIVEKHISGKEKQAKFEIVNSTQNSERKNLFQTIFDNDSSKKNSVTNQSELENTKPNFVQNNSSILENLLKESRKNSEEIVQKDHSFIEKDKVSENISNSINQEEKSLELVLEEEKKKKKDKVEIKQKSPLLAVSSYINPTMMLDSRSILADEFNDHNIKNNLTVAYGAKVSVRLNDKMNIRSGIAKVELEQSTANINSGINMGVYALSASNPKTMNNITYHSNIRVVADQTNQNAVMTMLSSDANNMEQKIHYIEIPLEVEYKLANFDKFNLLATAGGSYYVVTKNTISLTDSNTRSNYKLGEASNLNDMSYSANAGVKLEYNLSNKSSINLEPNYRYMLNPLKNVDAKNPSLLGVNLGFSIKF